MVSVSRAISGTVALMQGLIAGGTYMGEVYVWDLAQEGDCQVFKSTLSASSHQ